MKDQQLLNLIESISEEKNISKEIIINAIKEGFIKSYQKKYPLAVVEIDITKKGHIEMYRTYKVVSKLKEKNELEDEILLKNAVKNDKNIKLNDIFKKKINYSVFSRFAVNKVGQILKQSIKEAAKVSIYNKYQNKIGKIMSGKVSISEERYCLIELSDTFVFLHRKNMLPNDEFQIGDVINFYVEKIYEKTKNFAQIIASRVNNEFLIQLLEREIFEISKKIVLIKGISRQPGIRSKIAVYCNDKNINPVGACIGNFGARIKKVSDELNGEKIDILKWSNDIEDYIRNIFSPVEVLEILFMKDDGSEKRTINIVVKDDKFALAIGRSGLTIRMCVDLIGYKINVIKYSNFELNKEEIILNTIPKEQFFYEEGLNYLPNEDIDKELKLNNDQIENKSLIKKNIEEKEKIKLEQEKFNSQGNNNILEINDKQLNNIKANRNLKFNLQNQNIILKDNLINKDDSLKQNQNDINNLEKNNKKVLVNIVNKENKTVDNNFKDKKDGTGLNKKNKKFVSLLKISGYIKDYNLFYNRIKSKIVILNDEKYKNNELAEKIKSFYMELFIILEDNPKLKNDKNKLFSNLNKVISIQDLRQLNKDFNKLLEKKD